MKNLTDKVRNSVGIALVGTGLSTLCVFEYKLISNMLTKQQYSHNPLSLAQDIVIYGMAGMASSYIGGRLLGGGKTGKNRR